jgi:NAD(P)-dependent dehydrogenase (short-subunit alcohol dehydrogenase family)
MKTVVITGVSSGIGLASAIGAARAGFTAVGTIRRPEAAHQVRAAAARAGVEVDVVHLDVTDHAAVEASIESIVARHGRLDAVVNNAGYAGVRGTLELNTIAALRQSMEVNFFSVAAVSRAALPHLRATGGRLLTVSSVRGVIGQPFNDFYSASKSAVEGLMEALAPVAAEMGLSVSLIEPAAVRDTAFVANAPADPPELLSAKSPYASTFGAYRRWVGTSAVEGIQSAAEVAAVVVRTLTADRPAFRVPTSEYARGYLARKLVDPDGDQLRELARSWLR